MGTHSRIDAPHPRPWGSLPAPDLEHFPLYARAVASRLTLGPGDALHIPAFWAHWVFSTDDATAVSFWSPANASPDDRAGPPPAAGPGRTEPEFVELPRLDADDPRATELRLRGQPFFLPQACRRWPALEAWTERRLIEAGTRLYLRMAAAADVPNLCPFVKPHPAHPDGRMRLFPYWSLSSVVREAANRPDLNFVAVGTLDDDDCALSTDIEVLPFLSGAPLLPHAWWSRGDLHTGLHFDEHDGTLCVVRGRKHVLLFAPSQHPLLYFDWLEEQPLGSPATIEPR